MGTWIYGTSYVKGVIEEGDMVANSGTLVVEDSGCIKDSYVWGAADIKGGTSINTYLVGIMNVGIGVPSADYTTQVDNGELNITDLGTSWNATIDSGTEHIFNGGTAESSTLYSGQMIVDAGGIAMNTTIKGGTEYVSGVDGYATVDGGASMQIVESGGATMGTHAKNGGGTLVETGGAAYGVTLDQSCWEYVQFGGKTDVVKFNGGGASLTFGDFHDNTGTTILGFGAFDTIDFRGMVAGPGTTLTCTENSQNTQATLTLKDSVGQTTSLTLMGQYSAADFSYKNDGLGGIALTEAIVPLAGSAGGSLGGSLSHVF